MSVSWVHNELLKDSSKYVSAESVACPTANLLTDSRRSLQPTITTKIQHYSTYLQDFGHPLLYLSIKNSYSCKPVSSAINCKQKT